MRLFIEAADVWLFRDGRPFDALSDHRAQSLFPPLPSVIQGALRSNHLVVQGVDLSDRDAIEKAVGTATEYPPDFRVRGPFLARRTPQGISRYFPLPADSIKEGPTFRPVVPQLPPDGVRSSAPTPMLLWFEEEPEKVRSFWWLREDTLRAFLEGGNIPDIEEARKQKAVQTSGDLFERDHRMGIAQDEVSRTVRRGALFEVGFVQPQPKVGLCVEVEGLKGWSDTGLLRLGGEGRAGRFERFDGPPWPVPPDPLPDRFKVYLATPAYFEEGWAAGDWGRFFTGKVELKAAALGKYQSLGGYDVARKRDRACRRYVPAGSVYFFKCDGDVTLRPELTNRAITEHGAEIGFGQIIIGRW